MTSSIKIIDEKLLSDNWYILKKYTFEYQRKDGKIETQSREVYDRGNGATILLYNSQKKTVILTRQFRIPTYVNGNKDGMLIETCAGLLDQDEPETAIKRETEEETGYRISEVEKVFEAYMSPGSVTEILYFFIAEYSQEDVANEGGGVEDEPFGFRRDRSFKLCRGQLEIMFNATFHRHRGAACQKHHIGVRHPIGRGDDDLIAGVTGGHQGVVQNLLAAGANGDLVRRVF